MNSDMSLNLRSETLQWGLYKLDKDIHSLESRIAELEEEVAGYRKAESERLHADAKEAERRAFQTLSDIMDPVPTLDISGVLVVNKMESLLREARTKGLPDSPLMTPIYDYLRECREKTLRSLPDGVIEE